MLRHAKKKEETKVENSRKKQTLDIYVDELEANFFKKTMVGTQNCKLL